jgi:photosystem II stability/assembly factor-like uncharacterized protein
VSAQGNTLLAGTTEGVFRSKDLGGTWVQTNNGPSIRHIRWLAHRPGTPYALAGTEPAAVFVSDDDTRTWRACPEVAELRDQGRWYLPYSPEAGCVRGFAFHGARAYAAVEQGGLLRSDDGGETWRLVEGSTGDPRAERPPSHIHPDVHSVAVHPSSPDLVYAPTGGGLYRSKDGGKVWRCLYRCYCRAVWVDPTNSAHVVLGPADGVDRNGRIEQTFDGGNTWRTASTGLDVPWPGHMVERFHRIGDELLVVLSNGHLLIAPIETLAWQRILPQVDGIAAVASM